MDANIDANLEEAGKFYTIIVEFFANYSLQIVGALIILMIGVVVSKYVQKFLLKILLSKKVDETISRFATSFIRFLIIAMMSILALGKLGISIAPFIAALGALSLTAGLALQGSVSNFAAGIILILTKPFKLGDTLTVHEIYGEVQEIKLAYTLLVNEDGEQITIPNKYMIGDVLVNSFDYRIVEGSVGVDYTSDMDKTIQTITSAVMSNAKVNADNNAIVGIEKFNESSVDIAYRYWVPTREFYKVQYEVNLEVLTALQNAQISIPYPHREITIKEVKNDTTK